MTFQGLQTGNAKMKLMEQSSEQREELRKAHQNLVKVYQESLKVRDETIQRLEQRLKSYVERREASRAANRELPRNGEQPAPPLEKSEVQDPAVELPSAAKDKKGG